MKIAAFFLGCALIALLTGCEKRTTTARTKEAAPPPTAAATEAAAPAPAPPSDPVAAPSIPSPEKPPPPSVVRAPAPVAGSSPAVVAEDAATQNSTLLTSLLREFIRTEKRMPSSVGEFAALKMDSLPPAPPGMQWVINQQKQTVEARRK